MSVGALERDQLAMAAHLRDPSGNAPPAGVEERRLQVYRDLVYNNLERFISGGFPVLRTLYDAGQWEQLVRGFIREHRCATPYFLEIGQEFLRYLMEGYTPRACDPPFMLELAHYEWVELALDVAEEELPPARAVGDIAGAVLRLSPLAWVLAYQFPVHRIGARFRPAEPEPTYLAVYRNRSDAVKFIALNAATARLLELLRDNTGRTAGAVLEQLAGELALPQQTVRGHGLEQLAGFLELGVLAAD